MASETISVIMSVYNERPAWLRESIGSILAQTHRDIEFIIILDAPDNRELEEIIREYAAGDGRIVFLKNDRNRGLVHSLNRGLEIAAGAYIARMDADDAAEPDRLALQLRALREEELDLTGGNLLYMDEESALISDPDRPPYCYGKTADACPLLLGVRNFMPHPTWLVRAELYRAVGPYHDIPRAEDYEWLCRAALHGARMRKLETPVLRYRLRSSSISVSGAYVQRRVTCAVAGAYRKALRQGGDLDADALRRAAQRIARKDDPRYPAALERYRAACGKLKDRPAVGMLGLAGAFLRCPFLLRVAWDDARMDRIDRRFAAGTGKES